MKQILSLFHKNLWFTPDDIKYVGHKDISFCNCAQNGGQHGQPGFLTKIEGYQFNLHQFGQFFTPDCKKSISNFKSG